MTKLIRRRLTCLSVAAIAASKLGVVSLALGADAVPNDVTLPRFDSVEAQLEAGMRAAHKAARETTRPRTEPGTPGAKAYDLLLPLARAGCAQAQYVTGNLGLHEDIPESFTWYERAAGHGHPGAMSRIGFEHIFGGSGYKRNVLVGMVLLVRAANQGDYRSMKKLAAAHHFGSFGPSNLVQSFKWKALALPRIPDREVFLGSKTDADEMRQELAELTREMTQQQIKTATEMVVGWESRNDEIRHSPDHASGASDDEPFLVWYERVEGGCSR